MTTRHGGGGRDDERFDALYRKYARSVRRFFERAFRVTEDEAQDLAQETFKRFLEHMDEYRGDAVWAFLETVARNVGYNHVRALSTVKRGAVKPLHLDDPEVRHRERASEPDYVSRLDRETRLKRLQTEITSLPEGQRQCVQLFLSDLKYQAIANILGISLDAVRSRLRDARRELRLRLGADGELPEDES